MADDILKMKHHKLLFELKFLYADLEYHQTLMNGATKDFQEEFLKQIKNLGIYEALFPSDPPPPTEATCEDADNEKLFELDKKNVSKEVKKLFRQVVALTHPDKLVKLSEPERAHREAIFLRASDAAQNDNLFALQQIALDLGLPLSQPTEQQLKIFEKEATGVRKETNSMRQTYAWKWNECESDEEKGEVMQQYIDLMVTRAAKKTLDT